MALIEDYAGLQSELSDLLMRSDLDNKIPSFIQLCEAQLQRDVRHYEMENVATAPVATQFLDRPSDWLQTIRWYLLGNGTYALNMISRQAMAELRQGRRDETGIPRYYCLVDQQFELFPTPNDTFTSELLYYQKIPSLVDGAGSNWLLNEYPDIYLYGSALHSAPWLREDERLATWGQLYSAGIANLRRDHKRANFQADGLQMRVRGYPGSVRLR